MKPFFMNLKLSHKLLLGYIVVIFLPTVILEFSLYNQNYNSVLRQYIQNEQSALDIAQKNLSIQLNRIHESSEFLSSNTVLVSYLDGAYNTQSEELYYYIKSISPLLDYLMKSDPAILNITFFSESSYHLSWGGRLVSTDAPPIPDEVSSDIRGLIYGIWYKDPGNNDVLSYYRCLYNSNYSSPVATLCIDVSLSLLMENFSSLSGTVLAIFSESQSPLLYRDGALLPCPENTVDELCRNAKYCQSQLKEPELTVLQILDVEKSLNYNGNTLLFFLLLLFLILTAGYYIITASITKRISRLQKHIAQSEADHLTPLWDSGYRDEIGLLTNSYNQMVAQINHLIYQIYHAELEKKDAEFYALQAQIEPHFLYNILENIHMSAERSGDLQTSAMVVSLGKFMRYNLNNHTGFVHLSDELLHVKNYLDIHKIRMQDKLKVQISVYTEIDDILCPRFILQPLAENAIRHAPCAEETLIIEITVKARDISAPDSGVILKIHDNGKGIMPEALKELRASLKNTSYPGSTHIGLNSINNRLQAFYQNERVLQIDSSPREGTTVTLYLERMRGNADENINC